MEAKAVSFRITPKCWIQRPDARFVFTHDSRDIDIAILEREKLFLIQLVAVHKYPGAQTRLESCSIHLDDVTQQATSGWTG